MRWLSILILVLVIPLVSAGGPATVVAREPAVSRPLVREFTGVNGHTVQFKPDPYAKVCGKVRDYQSFEWDMGKETDFIPRFPESRNRVNWEPRWFGSGRQRCDKVELLENALVLGAKRQFFEGRTRVEKAEHIR
jgi:hypothetical protein